MKKILYLVAFCCAISQMLQASKLTDMIATQTGQKFSVLKEVPLKQDSNLKLVVLKDSQSGQKVVVISNKNETLLVGITQTFMTTNDADRDVIIDEVSMATSYNQSFQTHKVVKGIIAKIPQDYIITLNGKNPKKTYYIISDPLCPHCQHELQNIDRRLQNGNVKMIVVGMMNEQSSKKAAEIYREAKKAKSDSEKIALLKKVYNPNYKSKGGDERVVQEVTKALIGKGKVEGTPYIIEEDS